MGRQPRQGKQTGKKAKQDKPAADRSKGTIVARGRARRNSGAPGVSGGSDGCLVVTLSLGLDILAGLFDLIAPKK